MTIARGMAVLTDEHRRAIAASVPGVTITPDAWQEIDKTITGFEIFRSQRLTAPGLARNRKIYADLIKHIDAATAIVRDIMPKGADPGWRNRALTTFREVRDKAGAHRIGSEMQARSFRGTRDPHRHFLFGFIMDVWTGPLGGKLTYKRDNYADGRPAGPLIRFLDAVLRPVLGDETPSASGLGKIVDREKKARKPRRRRQFPSESKKSG